MIVSIHQPAYLPWLGLLERIYRSDVFVFLDTVQFEKGSYVNRNKIKTATGTLWLTVPVLKKGHLSKTINEIEIDGTKPWQEKHLKTIRSSYSRAPRFKSNQKKLESLFSYRHTLLSELCFEQLNFWLSELGICRRIERASDLPEMGSKSDLVLNICRYFNATKYISGYLGHNYLIQTDFHRSGIEVEFQDYRHPIYEQIHGDFVSNLSIVDFWMNCGDVKKIWETK